MSSRGFWVVALLSLCVARTADGQWARFRGPNGSGIGSGTAYPAEFSPSKNLVWKTAVPFGQSSPIVVGNRVFFTATEGDRLLTICVDAKNGRELWRREIRRERATKTFKANDPASPTPAADQRVSPASRPGPIRTIGVAVNAPLDDCRQLSTGLLSEDR